MDSTQQEVNDIFEYKKKHETITVEIPPVHPNARGGGGYGCYVTAGTMSRFRFGGYASQTGAIESAIIQLDELRKKVLKEQKRENRMFNSVLRLISGPDAKSNMVYARLLTELLLGKVVPEKLQPAHRVQIREFFQLNEADILKFFPKWTRDYRYW